MESKIITGDCISVLKGMEDNVFDGVVFSPPYNNIRDYNGFSIDLNGLGKELYRVLKDNTICACVIGDSTKDFAKSLTSFRLAIDWVDNCGFRLFECCIYNRDGRPGAYWTQRFRVDHEYIMLFLKGSKPKYFNKETLKVNTKHSGVKWHGTQRLTDGELIKTNNDIVVADKKCRGTIWKYNTSNTESNKLKMEHPATMPDKLAADLITCFVEPGGMVLDPTAGSGTTCVMAKSLGRNYVGIDISQEYVDIINKRLNNEFTSDIFQDGK